MNLPPTLLQRLAQRGLLQTQNAKKVNNEGKINEEVIAENYDESYSDQSDLNDTEYEKVPKKTGDENFWIEQMKERIGVTGSYTGYKYCPNKYNIWHKCSLYCVKRWETGREASEKYIKRYKRMVKRYPLPQNWVEVYDYGCGAFYFSNSVDLVVSWLPPTHPKANISKSAATYRRQLDNVYNGNNVDHDENKSVQKKRDIGKTYSRKRKDRGF